MTKMTREATGTVSTNPDTLLVCEIGDPLFAAELFARRNDLYWDVEVARSCLAKCEGSSWKRFCRKLLKALNVAYIAQRAAETKYDPTPEEEERGYPYEGVRLLKRVAEITGVEPKDLDDQTYWDGDATFVGEGDRVLVMVTLPDGSALRGLFAPEEFLTPPCGTDASLFPEGTPAKVAAHVLTTIFGSRDFTSFGLFADGLFLDTPAEDNEVNFKVEVLDTEKFELLKD